MIFDNNKTQFASVQKHSRLIYHSRLDFNQHTDGKTNKCHISIETMKTFAMTLSRKSLLTVYIIIHLFYYHYFDLLIPQLPLSLIKLQACNFIKNETLTQVFSCESYKISKNIFFTEHLWTTASVN